MSLEPQHDELLSRLEQVELALLSWGRVDGALTEAEVEEVARDVANDPDTATQLVDDLVGWHLLLDVGQRDPLYRTRFAESIRLLARNRQLLARRPWRTAPELVNDFRVIAQPRRYPKRDLPLPAVLQRLGESRQLVPAEEQALRAMLTSARGELELARFQYEATEHIRSHLRGAATSATMVCAGTGSGKTKAFYLPVLSALAADAASDPSAWARVLAIYPRNELLKDQLVEALSQIERIAARGGPVLAIGAYFGPTARSSKLEKEDGWYSTIGGHACRYMRCPAGCIADLVWRDDDRARGREVLWCPRCHWESRTGQIALTRDSIRAAPPHLLFTSTEMLNRCLADAASRHVFTGRTASQRPWALLLDEVHTYGGVHGGQVAMLLRRWRAALGRSASMHVVGLSATLESPEEFFARLTGIVDVRVVGVADEDLSEQGAEYAVVLRGNPVSGTALLSTTIQTSFLMGRILEARDAQERSGTSGSRVFAFTDNLDVTNRLFWDLRDAEQGRGGRDPLAVLRREDAPETRERDAAGQVWRLPPLLGRPLDAAHRLRVTRTSGQDAGVDLAADVIVATSALEVGFDDPEVGAVIQHKAPRDDAAFVQRRGRAGRQTDMRPWTAVVLSDYGRDRLRYQAYETLFAPTLVPRALPVDNLHVLKMQAAYVLLDWLAGRVQYLDARADLSGPAGADATSRKRRQASAADAMRQILADPRAERDFERHLRRALDLTDAQTRSVMWEPPRALMTSTIPTLLRRLEANWTTANGGQDLAIRGVPVPEHAPGALFSDLNLPEVEIVSPRPFEAPPRVESMSVPQALGEFLPGRSSRRFAVESSRTWHWVPRPSPDDDGVRRTDVTQWITRAELAGTVTVDGVGRQVLRPWRMELELVPSNEESANARPVWSAELTPSAAGWDVQVPQAVALHRLVPGLRFQTHALGNELRVIRAITSVIAQSSDGLDEPIELVSSASGTSTPAAVGFAADVDAVCAGVGAVTQLTVATLPPEALRAVRTSWFESAVANDAALRAKASRFSVGWLSTLYVAAVAGVAIAQQTTDLATTVAKVGELGTARCLAHALEGVFAVDLDEDETRGVERLRALIVDDDVIAALDRIAHDLVNADAAVLDPHAREVAIATIAGAIREGFQRLAPTFDAEALIIDVVADGSAAVPEIWLCEPDVGSSGTIDEIRRRIAEEPARFGRLVVNALGPTDLEIVDTEVRRAVRAAADPGPVADAFRGARAAVGAHEGTEAQRRLRAALRGAGITAEHGVMTTLNLRVLRPGSSPITDTTLSDALALWDAVESRLGLELDARAVAYAVSQRGGMTLEQVYSLLWPRGRDARSAGLSTYSRYSDLARPDRLVVSSLLDDDVAPVALGPSAAGDVEAGLRTRGIVRLVAPATSAEALRRLLGELLTQAIEVGSVAGYPRIVSASRHADSVTVTLELPEAAG